MRRVSLAWLLSLLLVFAQLGALLHELGHLSQGAAHGGAQLTQLHDADRGSCATCQGFAQVTNPAGSAHASLPAIAARLLPGAGPDHVFTGADTPTPRSRGPPHA
jgi:hypothetical protein